MQMKFKLYSRARIDLLELKSRSIHVLKNVEYNRELKSNRFFSVNKRLKKNRTSFSLASHAGVFRGGMKNELP